MRVKRVLGLVATVASLVGCGGAGTTAGTTSVPGAGGAGATPGGNGGGGTTGGAPGGTTPDGGAPGTPDGGTIAPCSPTPQKVADDLQPVASDGSYIYGWGTQRIARVALGGGATETLVGGIDVADDRSLAVDDHQIYWTWNDYQNDRTVLLRAPKSGGSAIVVSDGAQPTIVVDASWLYVINPSIPNSPLVRTPKDGGTTWTLNPAITAALAVDAQYAYWIGNQGEQLGLIERAPLDSGPAETIGSWHYYDPDHIGDIIADAHAFYIFDDFRIVRADLATGATATIFDPQLTTSVGGGDRHGHMSVDADSVYWVESDDDVEGPPPPNPNHWVNRVGKDGSGARTVAADQGLGHYAVGAGDSVYYDTDAALMRVCKP
ncbi:MAG TPA: hypothetical protein VGL86_29895 [Polyangia bacterium]